MFFALCVYSPSMLVKLVVLLLWVEQMVTQVCAFHQPAQTSFHLPDWHQVVPIEYLNSDWLSICWINTLHSPMMANPLSSVLYRAQKLAAQYAWHKPLLNGNSLEMTCPNCPCKKMTPLAYYLAKTSYQYHKRPKTDEKHYSYKSTQFNKVYYWKSFPSETVVF